MQQTSGPPDSVLTASAQSASQVIFLGILFSIAPLLTPALFHFGLSPVVMILVVTSHNIH